MSLLAVCLQTQSAQSLCVDDNRHCLVEKPRTAGLFVTRSGHFEGTISSLHIKVLGNKNVHKQDSCVWLQGQI